MITDREAHYPAGGQPTVRALDPPASQTLFTSLLRNGTGSRLQSVGFSLLDQAASAGSIFLANVVLARTQTREEFGLFVLSYSVYTFLAAIHNASIVEPYTVYGSGKYNVQFSEYLKLMGRNNALACLALTAVLTLSMLVLAFILPGSVPTSLIGLSLCVGVFLMAAFLRRTFYIRQEAHRAAIVSLTFLATCAVGLWLGVRFRFLNGFYVFVMLGAGWIVAMLTTGNLTLFGRGRTEFAERHPAYRSEHWKYARWVIATSLVFQLTSQGYYWLVAGVLSVREVAELRAMYLLVAPVDQLFIALSSLVFPKMAYYYASNQRSDFFSLCKGYELLTCVVTASVFLVLSVVGGTLVHWCYGGRFDDAVPVLFMLSALPFVMGVGNALSDPLKAMERPNVVFFAYLCSGITTCILGVPMVRHFGARGAAIGMLLSAAVYSLVLAGGFLAAIRSKPQLVGMAAN